MSITAEQYVARFDVAPEQDDLDRVNCKETGSVGHKQCGVCATHDKPRFICGCYFTRPTESEGPASDEASPCLSGLGST